MNESNVANKTIQAVTGATFTIQLEQNASTGYSWSYKADSPLNLVKEAEQSTAPVSTNDDVEAIVGAPTTQTWTFQADKAGTYTLTFKYERAWEKGTAPAKTVVYTVHVK